VRFVVSDRAGRARNGVSCCERQHAVELGATLREKVPLNARGTAGNGLSECFITGDTRLRRAYRQDLGVGTTQALPRLEWLEEFSADRHRTSFRAAAKCSADDVDVLTMML